MKCPVMEIRAVVEAGQLKETRLLYRRSLGRRVGLVEERLSWVGDGEAEDDGDLAPYRGSRRI